MSIDIKKCKIEVVVDTQEKEWLHIANVWNDNGVKFKKRHIKTGDYTIEVTTPEGKVIKFDDIIVIERKRNIGEICGNIFDRETIKEGKNRFERELIRSLNVGTFIVLIEDKDGYLKVLTGDHYEGRESKVHPNSLNGKLLSYKSEYGFELVWMDPRVSASYIYKLLYYKARAYLKNMNEI